MPAAAVAGRPRREVVTPAPAGLGVRGALEVDVVDREHLAPVGDRVVEQVGGADRQRCRDRPVHVDLPGLVEQLRRPVPGRAVPPVAAGAEQQRLVLVGHVRARDVLVAVEHHRPAVLGVQAHHPAQVFPHWIGGEGDPAAVLAPIRAAPGLPAGLPADRLDRVRVVQRQRGVVDERQVRDRVIGPHAVSHRHVLVRQRQLSALHQCCRLITAYTRRSSQQHL
jgi:hypothetical protein